MVNIVGMYINHHMLKKVFWDKAIGVNVWDLLPFGGKNQRCYALKHG